MSKVYLRRLFYNKTSMRYFSTDLSMFTEEKESKIRLIQGRYNNFNFKIPDTTDVNASLKVSDFIQSFSSDTINSLRSTRSKALGKGELSSHDFQVFDRESRVYLQGEDNLYDHKYFDIADYRFSKDAFSQRYIDYNFKHSNKFQSELNKFIKINKNRKIRVIKNSLESYYQPQSDKVEKKDSTNYVSNLFKLNNKQASEHLSLYKLNFSKFMKSNSDRMNCQTVTIKCDSFKIPDLNQAFFLKSADLKTIDRAITTGNSLKALPITFSENDDESFNQGICDNFTLLKQLCTLSNKSYHIGINTSLSKTVFVLYKSNNSSQVENEENFHLSVPYQFNIFDEARCMKGVFSYFMDITQNLILNNESISI